VTSSSPTHPRTHSTLVHSAPDSAGLVAGRDLRNYFAITVDVAHAKGHTPPNARAINRFRL
jgi:hypothetical protein